MATIPRNKHFHITDIPSSVTIDHDKTDGVLSFLNPTRATLNHGTDASASYQWRSRDNRKGRHAIDVSESSVNKSPASTRRFAAIMRNILRMITDWNYWDVSWIVAVLFTLGSVVWCLNGFFSYLPLVRPESEFPGEVDDAVGWTAWLGATIFEIGSVFLMIEALNESSAACFGWELKEAVEKESGWELTPAEDQCRHIHHKGRIWRKKSSTKPMQSVKGGGEKEVKWVWWPSWYSLKSHYLRQIGFLACAFQMLGATIFWIAGWTAIPGVIDMENVGLTDGVFWTPQVVGGMGFVISSFLFMLETQKTWYRPALDVLGWHIGFWNLIGAIGFTSCGALGYSPNSKVLYQSTLATFWGSWAFLIGSLLQWYEAVDKHPVKSS